jgi:hypothetical protein
MRITKSRKGENTKKSLNADEPTRSTPFRVFAFRAFVILFLIHKIPVCRVGLFCHQYSGALSGLVPRSAARRG